MSSVRSHNNSSVCSSSAGYNQAVDGNDKKKSGSPAATQAGSSLSCFFRPRSIAVVGATDRVGSVSKTVIDNLKCCRDENGDYAIYPVNPTRKVVCGLPAFPDVSACPAPVDLAVVVTPARTVKAVVESCGLAHVPAVIIISAGFKEIGAAGLQLENDVVAIARQYNIRLLGPNCLGVMSPYYGINATFAASNAIPGPIAFISQSGAMCTAVLDWSLKERLGFSAFVSIGSMADVCWGDLIDYLGSDPNTRSILIYMETVGDAAHFISAAKAVSIRKPIVVIKAGQTEAAANAAVSHTGSLACSHDAFLTAMERAGVMVVSTIEELFNCALILGKQPLPRGENLLIITNAGGPGVLATDATTLSGAVVCKLQEKTIDSLNSFLPEAWSRGNPVDILGDASADMYARTLELSLADENVDGVLVVLAPQSVTDAMETARKVVEVYSKVRVDNGTLDKPLICSWMGGLKVTEGFNYLSSNSIPTFAYPDAAARTYGKIWSYIKHLQSMYTPSLIDLDPYCESSRIKEAILIIEAAREQGRYLLPERESKQVLSAFGVPVAETIVCSTVDDAVRSGDMIGYPCVVKLHSETMTHKSDVGGVKLNIQSGEEVRAAWNSIKASVDKFGSQHFHGVSVQPMLNIANGIELIFGSNIDKQFGPLVLFGAGGSMVEIIKDRALGIPPLNPALAQIQMESTNIYKALKCDHHHGQRFPNVDLASLNKFFCKFSQMVCELSEYVTECDINPFLALSDRLVALDARFVLRKPDEMIPKLVIRPYPRDYLFYHIFDGRQVLVRPIHSNDFRRLVEFQRGLTGLAVYLPFPSDILPMGRHGSSSSARQIIALAAAGDYSRSVVLAAVDESKNAILGIIRLTRCPSDLTKAEFYMVTREDLQRKGLGGILLEYAVQVAKSESIQSLQASAYQENDAMLILAERLKFKQEVHPVHPGMVKCSLELY